MSDPFDETDREDVVEERECKICHELFLTNEAASICDRCHRDALLDSLEQQGLA